MRNALARARVFNRIQDGRHSAAGARRVEALPVASPMYSAKMKAPFAVLGIRTGGSNVTGVEYLPRSERPQAPTDAVAERACRQIERYLADPQFRFSLPLAPAVTLFRRRVWDTLAEIPVVGARAAERGDIDLYLAAQFHAKAKSTSIGRRLSSLRRFYRLQAAQGAIVSDPTLRVRAPKLSRALPKSLSEKEVEALLDAPDRDTT